MLAQAPSVGLILMGSSSGPICANAEALKILSYPETQEKTESIEKLVIEKVRSVLSKWQNAQQSSSITDVTSGRRRYVCRFFALASLSGKSSQRTTALLLERNSAALDVLSMAREFNLTQRECEAVEYLAQGLTSKEIANRMRINPSTVSAFLRLVMIKTGTSNRSGIIGKLVQI